MNKTQLTVTQKFKMVAHYLTPQRTLTAIAGFFAKRELGFLTTLLIKSFSAIYGIKLNNATLKQAQDYKTFNQFFTRFLEDGARPIEQANYPLIISPAEGKISQAGKINGDYIIQAKNHYYTVADLIADSELANLYRKGSFINIYLSPRDYHNVHMPISGKLIKTIYVPGELWSVSALIAQQIPQVFARNERLVCFFETELGYMVQVLVGATITASINTSWNGVINTNHGKEIVVTDYQNKDIFLQQGEIMGAFLLGSTVITLFANPEIKLEKLLEQQIIRVNQTIAHITTEII